MLMKDNCSAGPPSQPLVERARGGGEPRLAPSRAREHRVCLAKWAAPATARRSRRDLELEGVRPRPRPLLGPSVGFQLSTSRSPAHVPRAASYIRNPTSSRHSMPASPSTSSCSRHTPTFTRSTPSRRTRGSRSLSVAGPKSRGASSRASCGGSGSLERLDGLEKSAGPGCASTGRVRRW